MTDTISEKTEVQKKKNSTLPVILAVFVVMISCLLCCCLTIVGLGFAGVGVFFGAVDRIDEEILDDICNASTADLRDVYEDVMSERYRRSNSFAEFEALYDENREFFGECDNVLQEIDWTDFFNDFSINYSGENDKELIEIEFGYNDQIVFLRAVDEKGELKLDDIRFRDK